MSQNVPKCPVSAARLSGRSSRCSSCASQSQSGGTFGENEPKRTQRNEAKNLSRERQTRFLLETVHSRVTKRTHGAIPRDDRLKPIPIPRVARWVVGVVAEHTAYVIDARERLKVVEFRRIDDTLHDAVAVVRRGDL